jgi:hypothetical protein
MIRVEISPYRLAWSRTQAFQAWYMGSNPVRGTNNNTGNREQAPAPGFLSLHTESNMGTMAHFGRPGHPVLARTRPGESPKEKV